jgi:acyl phosphate:glycerol-3-phosphate acyltransferase
MISALTIALVWLGSYLAGSIPAGIVFSRLFRGIDVRQSGSGNIGSANVFRVAGPVPGALTLLFDAAKGFLPVIIAQQLGLPLWAQLLSGGAAIIGHNWSIILRGRGGKGIATSLGVLLAFAPLVTLIAMAVWIVVIVASRYASLASLLMIASVPILLALFHYDSAYWIFGVGLVLLAIYRHRGNIERLLHGTELKIRTSAAGRGG